MAYTLHVDRGVPRIVAAAAAADPPNDPDVVALPGGAVTAEQAQRHNAQATAMEQAIVPLRASELVMLRDLAVAMRSLPWYVGPTDSLDAVCAFEGNTAGSTCDGRSARTTRTMWRGHAASRSGCTCAGRGGGRRPSRTMGGQEGGRGRQGEASVVVTYRACAALQTSTGPGGTSALQAVGRSLQPAELPFAGSRRRTDCR